MSEQKNKTSGRTIENLEGQLKKSITALESFAEQQKEVIDAYCLLAVNQLVRNKEVVSSGGTAQGPSLVDGQPPFMDRGSGTTAQAPNPDETKEQISDENWKDAVKAVDKTDKRNKLIDSMLLESDLEMLIENNTEGFKLLMTAEEFDYKKRQSLLYSYQITHNFLMRLKHLEETGELVFTNYF
jgi:hypothetical protein